MSGRDYQKLQDRADLCESLAFSELSLVQVRVILSRCSSLEEADRLIKNPEFNTLVAEEELKIQNQWLVENPEEVRQLYIENGVQEKN